MAEAWFREWRRGMTESCCSKRSGAGWRALAGAELCTASLFYRRGGQRQQGRRRVVQQPGVNTHSAELVAEAMAALTARATRQHGRRARLQRGGGVAWGGTAWCRVQRVVPLRGRRVVRAERGRSMVRGAGLASCRGVDAAMSCSSMVAAARIACACVACLADELACVHAWVRCLAC